MPPEAFVAHSGSKQVFSDKLKTWPIELRRNFPTDRKTQLLKPNPLGSSICWEKVEILFYV
jgi:hypothetical protein